MTLYQQAQAQNDVTRNALLQRIDDLVSTLRLYKEALREVEPTLSDRDRRVLLFTVARCTDAYLGEVQHSQGILLALAQKLGVRS